VSAADASVEEHEAGLAAFLLADRRQRFRRALVNERSRVKLLAELYHYEHRLDPAFATPLALRAKHDAFVADVCARLLAAGAPPDCVSLRAQEPHRRAGPLAEAVPEILRSGAGFVSCVPGRLGLYVGEDGSNVFLLARPDEPATA
jgi:hypothetical protein